MNQRDVARLEREIAELRQRLANLPVRIGVPTTRADYLIPVELTVASGAAGSETTACTYTYDVTDLDGNEVGSALTPAYQRPSVGRMLYATVGTGYFDADGVFVLWSTDEHLATEAC